ncbi:hypothetical protein [Jiulongibacter sp. NS-SX5]|uniref:hypothetical protein n=1 Tax=Jiulongibacter sp. NS-SX5 TaxID=3463854 RepID=UPI004057FDD0
MKPLRIKITFALIVTLGLLNASAQEEEEVTKKLNELSEEIQKLTDKTVKFGISLGYRGMSDTSAMNYILPSVSPLDSSLYFSQLDNGGLILSTSILFNPKFDSDPISRRLNQSIFLHLAEHYKTLKVKDISLPEQFMIRNMAKYDHFSLEEDKPLKDQAFMPTDKDYYSNGEHMVEAVSYLQLINKWISNADKAGKKELRQHRREIQKLVAVKFLVGNILDKTGITANLNVLEFSRAQQELTFNKAIEGGLGLTYALNPNIHLSVTREHFFHKVPVSYFREFEGKKFTLPDGSTLVSSSEIDYNNQDLFINRYLKGGSFKVVVFF